MNNLCILSGLKAITKTETKQESNNEPTEMKPLLLLSFHGADTLE